MLLKRNNTSTSYGYGDGYYIENVGNFTTILKAVLVLAVSCVQFFVLMLRIRSTVFKPSLLLLK